MRSQDNKRRIGRLALVGIALALAIVVSLLEQLIPINALIPLPYVKLGFANVIIIFLLYRVGALEALTVSLLRVTAVSLLFGTVTTFIFSLFGAMLSFLCALLLKKAKGRVSFIGVSVVSAAMHNTGQIIAACITFGSLAPIHYLPVLLLTSVIVGAVTGVILVLCDEKTRFLSFYSPSR